MWAEIVILLLGFLLVGYWFRRNTLAVLKSRAIGEPAHAVAGANRLNFLEIRQRLQAGGAGGRFEALGHALAEDYRVLTFLLRHAGGADRPAGTLMDRMLMLDFRLMQAWFHITRRVSQRQALRALEEMSAILGQLAESMGRRLALSGPGASTMT